jgi:hypothetical protein
LGTLNQAFTSEANLTGFADNQMIMNGNTNGIGSRNNTLGHGNILLGRGWIT